MLPTYGYKAMKNPLDLICNMPGRTLIVSKGLPPEKNMSFCLPGLNGTNIKIIPTTALIKSPVLIPWLSFLKYTGSFLVAML